MTRKQKLELTWIGKEHRPKRASVFLLTYCSTAEWHSNIMRMAKNIWQKDFFRLTRCIEDNPQRYCLLQNPTKRCTHGSTTQPQQPPLLSSGPVSVAKGSRRKRRSNADGKSSTGTKNSPKSLVATIRVSATRAAGFKNCCMPTGRYDGALRNDFF
jgi:hypothetical protein